MFIGRQHELELLAEALRPGVAVAIVGASGMGKSELARAYCRGKNSVWVDCGGTTSDELLFRIEASDDDASTAAADVLNDADVVVLDDWDPEITLNALREVFDGPIIVTSQVAPAQMPSLPVPPFDQPDLDDLKESEAYELFAATANQVRLGAASDFDPAAVRDIIAHVAGHPLGIVLAGRHAASVGAAEVSRLMQAGTELTDARRSPRQQSMQLALEFSWRQLGDRNQTVLYLASRFDRPVRVVTIAELAGIDVSDALDAIRELTQCGALLAGSFPRPVRVWRDTALSRLGERDDADALEQTLFDRAVRDAQSSLDRGAPGPIDDSPSLWEAALRDFEQHERADVVIVLRALLTWSHRFSPARYHSSGVLEEAAVWAGDPDVLLRRVSMTRGKPELHRAAIDAAAAVVETPADRATLHFERAMGASIAGDIDEALVQLGLARGCEANLAAMLLEVALRMFQGDHDEARRRMAELDELEVPSLGHRVVIEHHRIWLLAPEKRLEAARAAAEQVADATPRVRVRGLRTLADALEREHGRYDEVRSLREEVREIGHTIDHAKLIADMDCELAWGALCAGDLDAARKMNEVDPDGVTAEAKLRHAAVLAMLAAIDGDAGRARFALDVANRESPHVPSVLGVLDIVDAAIRLLQEEDVEAAGHIRWMIAAVDARQDKRKKQLKLFNELRELLDDTTWSARFAIRWIEAHASPFLQRLLALEARDERVVVLSDGSALRVDDDWQYVPGTTAALLLALSSGKPATFEELKEAGWPGEVATWDAVVNRVNVNISKLRGMGLKPVLRKVTDGFVIDSEIFVESDG